MTPEQAMYAGDRAREVLENEAFIQAFADIEQELTRLWKTSPENDSTAREHHYRNLMSLARVKTALEASLSSGRLAMEELRHKQTLLERARDFLS